MFGLFGILAPAGVAPISSTANSTFTVPAFSNVSVAANGLPSQSAV
jgi:hypothetical protein